MLNHHINIGRDAFFNLLSENNLLVRKRKRRKPITTFSDHWMRKYPNLIEGFYPTASNQLWVSDITYIIVGNGFCYLSLITDAYSRKIIGFYLSPNLAAEGWLENIETLSAASGIEVVDYHSYIHALEQRRAFFKTMGAHATDHGVYSASTQELSLSKAEEIFHRALKNEATPEDAACFTSHMLMEMARMSSEDGLVMQIHVGSYRNHNNAVFQKFGPDNGFDIPVTAEFTKALRPLLNKFGNASNLNLILFCLDEDVYSRELAPLAGVYPSVKLGPPWWFYDSPNGMKRYFDRVMETAGIYNTAGFNDDTRAFLSIPARHDVWRRVSSNWLAELMLTGRIDEEDALDMAYQLAYGLVKKAYRFE